ncbi:MAG: deoxyguanosinetriphosphate triphosphohydrolase [Hyphomicrobium sp.]|nr:deoxyguanosinetriphosphate triphosphohydrolase [Hyphomicrobium sp.]
MAIHLIAAPGLENPFGGAQDDPNGGHGESYGAGLEPGARSPASYAASAVPSRGRAFAETECPTRSPFQRDRDRILHSSAFRRLTYKTQVFLFHEGDHYRTRLTHSLEVAQIARTIARQLRLDEDLAEALALAHDLGHSPFGHAGERALDRAMVASGGFDHNAQSLRVVTRLERKYLGFDGLNLTWETLEGLAKHNGPLDERVNDDGPLDERVNHNGPLCERVNDNGPLDERVNDNGPLTAAGPDQAVVKVTRHLEPWQSLNLGRWPSAEAQAAAIADDIAYVNHDIDDGLRAGLISVFDLDSVPLAGPAARAARSKGPSPDDHRQTYEITRRMITLLIRDCVAASRLRLAEVRPAAPDDIRAAGRGVVGFSNAMQADLAGLKAFLFARVYRHPRVNRIMAGAEQVVEDLFARYMSDVATMPPAWRAAADGLEPRRRARLVADFVAGQTDRFAMAEHRRLFDVTPELR